MIPIRPARRKAKPARILLLSSALAATFIACAGGKSGNASHKQHQQESATKKMKTILIIGMNPHTIDFTNPELPKGLTAAMVEQGIKATLEKLNNMGYHTEVFLIDTGATDLSSLAKQLENKRYSGIVVGNGIRGQAVNFLLFEQIINVVHTHAPGAKIIFNTLPTDTDEAVKRWL